MFLSLLHLWREAEPIPRVEPDMDERPVSRSSFERPPEDPGSPLKLALPAQSVYRTSVYVTPHVSSCTEVT